MFSYFHTNSTNYMTWGRNREQCLSVSSGQFTAQNQYLASFLQRPQSVSVCLPDSKKMLLIKKCYYLMWGATYPLRIFGRKGINNFYLYKF